MPLVIIIRFYLHSLIDIYFQLEPTQYHSTIVRSALLCELFPIKVMRSIHLGSSVNSYVSIRLRQVIVMLLPLWHDFKGSYI